MVTALGQVARVAAEEFGEAARSRRAAVLLLLYMAAALLTVNAVVSGLQRMEREVRSLMGISAEGRTGSVTEVLWQSERFRGMLRGAVRDEAAVRDLFDAHPLALAYGWLAFFYTPLLVLLVTPARVAEELAAGTARYALARVSRARWCLGKALAHAALTGAAVLMGALGAWIVMRLRLGAGDGGRIALGLLGASLRTWVYACAFVGLGCGLGFAARSGGRATALAILLLMALAVGGWAGGRLDRTGRPRAAHALRTALPLSYRMDLWRRAPARWGGGALALVAIGALGGGAGAARLGRKDL